MALNLVRFKTPSAGLKATNMIVLVHKLAQRVLTSNMSAWECMCEKSVYIRVRECVYTRVLFSQFTCPARVKMDIISSFKCPVRR